MITALSTDVQRDMRVGQAWNSVRKLLDEVGAPQDAVAKILPQNPGTGAGGWYSPWGSK